MSAVVAAPVSPQRITPADARIQDLVEGGYRGLGVGMLGEPEAGPDGSRSNRSELGLDGLAVRRREPLRGLDDDVEHDGAGSEP